MPDACRFVILLHQSAEDEHWDIMLETDSALSTWSIPPQCPTGESFACSAMVLPDHRKAYLDYEGEITQNRGRVSRIDHGTYQECSPQQFFLDGAVFSGKLTVETDMMVFEKIEKGEISPDDAD